MSRLLSKNVCFSLRLSRRLLASDTKRIVNENRVLRKTEEPFDVIVNGGGIVGLSFLLALQKSPYFSGKRVLLLEQAKKKPILKYSENEERRLSNRVSSLTSSSKHFFEEIDVWSDIEPFAKEIRSMHVWSHLFNNGITFNPSNPSFSDSFYMNGKADESVCYVVENNCILNALNKAVPDNWIRFESGLTELSENGSNVDVVVNGDEAMSTSLLVASDGFNSIVRKNSNIKYFEQDLNQNAIVGTVEVSSDLENDANDVAYQRFIPSTDSVLAILPLTENYASFVLSVPSSTTETLMSVSDEEFVDALNDALFTRVKPKSSSLIDSAKTEFDKIFHSLLPSCTQHNQTPRPNPPQIISLDPKSRATFPLRFGTTLPYLVSSPKGGRNNKVVIIGDAAHRIHPLAGQGLNLGIGDAHTLAYYLSRCLSNGEKLFDSQPESVESLTNALFDFENSRQIKLITMLTAIHSMQMLFNCIPSACLTVFNNFNFLKSEIVKFANYN